MCLTLSPKVFLERFRAAIVDVDAGIGVCVV